MYSIKELSHNGPKLDNVTLNISGIGNFSEPGKIHQL